MDKSTPKPKYSFTIIQNVLAGIAVTFYAIYKFELSDPQIIKDLGTSYPTVIMVWVMIMLFSGGISGFSGVLMIIKYAPAILKTISLIKKEVKDGE